MPEENRVTSGLTPYISVDGAKKAIEFYKRAFDAKEINVVPDDKGGRVMHAALAINGAPLYLGDFFPDHGYPPVPAQAFNLHLQVEDADKWWKRAVDAGCTVTLPLAVQFWGDTYGQVRDPFGVTWAIGQSPAK